MSKNFRVAMIIQAYYPRLGGAERQLASLLPFLRELGIEVRIYTRRYDLSLPPFELIDDTPVFRLPVPGPKSIAALSFSANAIPLIYKFKPDIIHAHELLSPATTAVMAKRFLNIPVVAKVLRGGDLGDLAKLKRRAFSSSRLKSIKNGVDSFIVISNEIDRELAELGVAAEKRIFIPNGVDLNRFSLRSSEDKIYLRRLLNLPDGLIAVFSGRLDAEKKVDNLVQIWPMVLKLHPNATLLVLGTGTEEEKIKQLAGDNVRFEGNVRDVSPYLGASDIFVLPSSTEGLSNSLLEAMASGLSPVATSVGGAIDLIKSSENGILIPPEDTQSILSAILTLFGDASLRARIARNNRKFIEDNYSLASVAKKISLLYQKHSFQESWR